MSFKKNTIFSAFASTVLAASSLTAHAQGVPEATKIANGLSLYAATPRVILSTEASVLDSAFDAIRSPTDKDTKATWFRVHWGSIESSSIAQARLKGFSALDAKQQIDTNLAVIQVGRTMLNRGGTRIDLFGGIAGHESGTGSSRKRAFETIGGVAALGTTVDHLNATGIRARLGAQMTIGSADFKVKDKGLKAQSRDKYNFSTTGFALKGEVSKDFDLGRQFVLTPALGFAHQMAWINPKDTNNSKSLEHAFSMSASTRLAYRFDGSNGRAASAWVEPSYVNHIKRTAGVKGGDLDFSSRGPSQEVGAAIGMLLPVAKQGEFSTAFAYSRSLGNVKHKQATLNIGYAHRF